MFFFYSKQKNCVVVKYSMWFNNIFIRYCVRSSVLEYSLILILINTVTGAFVSHSLAFDAISCNVTPLFLRFFFFCLFPQFLTIIFVVALPLLNEFIWFKLFLDICCCCCWTILLVMFTISPSNNIFFFFFRLLLSLLLRNSSFVSHFLHAFCIPSLFPN